MARHTSVAVYLLVAAAALATAHATSCPAASSGPIQCYTGSAVTAPAGSGLCVCACGSSSMTATDSSAGGQPDAFIASGSSACSVSACKSKFASMCGAAAYVQPVFQTLSSLGFTGPSLTTTSAGSMCQAWEITCTAATAAAGFCPPSTIGLQIQSFGIFNGSNAATQCTRQSGPLSSIGAAFIACSTSACNSAAAIAAAPQPAPIPCPVSPSTSAISCYAGQTVTPPPALVGGGICDCSCGPAMGSATDSSSDGTSLTIAMSSSSSCSAAACKSAFPFCASNAYAGATYLPFTAIPSPSLVPVGVGAICVHTSYTCTSAMIAAGMCPVGSTGGSVVTYSFTNGSQASYECSAGIAQTGVTGGLIGFCNSNACNATLTAVSPAARPVLAPLRALAVAAAAAAALLL